MKWLSTHVFHCWFSKFSPDLITILKNKVVSKMIWNQFLHFFDWTRSVLLNTFYHKWWASEKTFYNHQASTSTTYDVKMNLYDFQVWRHLALKEKTQPKSDQKFPLNNAFTIKMYDLENIHFFTPSQMTFDQGQTIWNCTRWVKALL